MDESTTSLHTEVLDHASDTVISEINDASELFYSNRCETIKPEMVVGTASVAFPEVHRFSEQQTGYFCRYAFIGFINTSISRLKRYYYNQSDAAYTSPLPSHCVVKDENCHFCTSTANSTYSHHTNRFSLEQQKYHCHDFVLFSSNNEGSTNDVNADDAGPCHIGQIIKIEDTTSDLLIRRLGRVDDIRPVGVKRDEVRYFMCTFPPLQPC